MSTEAEFHILSRLIGRQLELLAELLERNERKHGLRRWVVVIHPLEPIIPQIPKVKTMDPLNIGQIPLGMRLPVTFVPDEDVDVKPSGEFGQVDVTSGDATAAVKPGSTKRSITVYFNGDGAIGQKSATFAVDGHVGPEDKEITQEIDWEVVSPDATTFTAQVGTLEPIPVPGTAAKK